MASFDLQGLMDALDALKSDTSKKSSDSFNFDDDDDEDIMGSKPGVVEISVTSSKKPELMTDDEDDDTPAWMKDFLK